MLKVFIVDDEAPARSELRYLLEQFPEVEVVGEADSGSEALEKIPPSGADAVFLDIQLHDRDGVDVGRELYEFLEKPPMIVFASAYEIHAVRAFETDAIDYIVKPFNEVRLRKTMKRVSKWLSLQEKDQPVVFDRNLSHLLQHLAVERQPQRIPAEKNGRILLIDPNEIVFATLEGRHAVIYTQQEHYLTSFTLQELEQRLLSGSFCRTHRAYLANLSKAVELVPWFNGTVHLVMQDCRKSQIPVSRSSVKEVKKRLGF
ncbi:LytR/AlgR family response regulator transcription factor [Brevibacillus fulvus]|uniref:DNA-binding LytR/AlgR family response regulator n=1 Tax=Brevibacillus fulvus TaxID=1125967 RepID=A0A939BVJ2_9BACL|nr:LytTR family DNA-binding domain-containing protein [Brevibacillus fulvus]MBM7590731.1 DNA-binding LytR/AlgR family response regulator [Brevibacillus fulvus]